MTLVGFEIFLILILLVINGIFSMSELAVVSARRVRLQNQADKGNKGALAALELAQAPGKFLSTVQIGITSIGILAGAFGGVTIAEFLGDWLNTSPVIAPYGTTIGFVVVIAAITYFSIIIGELIPKSIALNSPEKIASWVARPMKLLSFLASPIVWLLSSPTSFFLKLFKVHASVEPPVTDEEIKGLIDVGTKAGVFEESEQDLIESIIHLDDRRVSSLMTPRTKIVWLNLSDDIETVTNRLVETNYSRVPVCEGSLDAIIGYISAKTLLKVVLKEKRLDLRSALLQPLYVPETNTVLDLLKQFKEAHTHFAIVIDEFGGVEGLVTMNDVLEAIVGALSNSQHKLQRGAVRLESGSLLLEGRLSIIELKELLGVKDLPGEDSGQYHTLAGFIMTVLEKVPSVGERFEWSGYMFEVVAMESNRLDKVLVTPLKTELSVTNE
jgi:putative hemolysin